MISRPENMGNIESLLKSNDVDRTRWYPTRISVYENELRQGILIDMDTSFRSNIAYSLQYLEFLERQLAELKLSSVIDSLVIKSYIITSAAIIEIVFYHIAKVNNKIKKNFWKQGKLQDIKNIKSKEGKIQKISQMIQTKLDEPIIEPPTFKTLISIVRDNKLLNEVNVNAWNRYFKSLRTFIKVTLCTMIMIVSLMIVNLLIPNITESRFLAIVQICLYGIIAVIVYFIVAYKSGTIDEILGKGSLKKIYGKIKRKIKK